MRSRRGLILAVTAIALAACSSGGAGSPASSTAPGTSTAPVISAAPGTTTAPASTVAPVGTAKPGARNVAVDDAVREQLVTTWATASHVDRSYVTGTRSGSVYYAYVPSTGEYWAMAAFVPSAAAVARDKVLNGAAGDPLISFQDGPWVFSRTTQGSWRLVADTGGNVCSPHLPASVVAAWNLTGQGSC